MKKSSVIRKTTILQIAGVLLFFLGTAFLLIHAQKKPDSSSTKIITDQENGMITFIIDGQPVALFDKNGLHVAGAIESGAGAIESGVAEQ